MRFRNVAFVSAVALLSACSSSSKTSSSDASTTTTPDADTNGGDGSAALVCTTTTPQTTNAGACNYLGLASADAGEDAAAPVIYCIEYSGSGQVVTDSMQSCKTIGGQFSTNTCATVNASLTSIGYCLRTCGEPLETTQYYYGDAVVAKSQCEALSMLGYVWVPAQ